MSNQPDILIYSPDRRLRLAIEVKGQRGTSAAWAAHVRHSMLMHELIHGSSFFLFVTPDHFYLWKEGQLAQDIILPDYEIESANILDSYVRKIGIPLERLSSPGLEMLIISWIHDQINLARFLSNPHPEDGWIFDSGLHQALKSASVVLENE